MDAHGFPFVDWKTNFIVFIAVYLCCSLHFAQQCGTRLGITSRGMKQTLSKTIKSLLMMGAVVNSNSEFNNWSAGIK